MDQQNPKSSFIQQLTLQAILRIKLTKTVSPFFGWSEEEAWEAEELGGGGGEEK